MLDLDKLELIDLTHSINSTIPSWVGGCGFVSKIQCDYSDCEGDVKFKVQQFQMLAGIGTHMDAPLHCIPNANSISDIPLKSLIMPCRMIDVSDRAHERYCVSLNDVMQFENQYGKIPQNSFVIFYTGWDQWWYDPIRYRNELIFPSISKEVASYLIQLDIAGIGIDTLSPDRGDSNFPVHQIILGAGKYIIENIYQARQLGAISFIMALPMKIQGATESPVRLIGFKNKI